MMLPHCRIAKALPYELEPAQGFLSTKILWTLGPRRLAHVVCDFARSMRSHLSQRRDVKGVERRVEDAAAARPLPPLSPIAERAARARRERFLNRLVKVVESMTGAMAASAQVHAIVGDANARCTRARDPSGWIGPRSMLAKQHKRLPHETVHHLPVCQAVPGHARHDLLEPIVVPLYWPRVRRKPHTEAVHVPTNPPIPVRPHTELHLPMLGHLAVPRL
mmetsp:Transcript_47391/g.101163  ORF Transcript_47391/g.101163 Transcript_47391/m.101163 type:complete len:220 (-) Transcript_47391:552-1211(-)